MIRIIGIDPGLAQTGYGIVEMDPNRCIHIHHGIIKTASTDKIENRLCKLYDALGKQLDHYKPEICGIETLYFSRNRKSAMPVSQALGVIILCMGKRSIAVNEYTPKQIKQAITGSGASNKEQVRRFVKIILGLKEVPRSDHVTDALAAAFCCFNMLKYEFIQPDNYV